MNTIYNIARYKFASGLINWSTQKLVLIAFAGEPTFIEGDIRITDIVARGVTQVLGHSLDIVGNTVSQAGYLQTGPVVIPSLPVGPPVTHFIMANRALLWDDGEPLLFIDTALDLPFTPNGLDLIIQPDWTQERGWGRV